MVLASDGTLAYSNFIYEDLEAVNEISDMQSLAVGFSAGDGERFTNVASLDESSVIHSLGGEWL